MNVHDPIPTTSQVEVELSIHDMDDCLRTLDQATPEQIGAVGSHAEDLLAKFNRIMEKLNG